MKKLFTLLVVLAGCVSVASATPKRIYVKTDGNWMQHCGGVTYLHIFNAGDANTEWPGIKLEVEKGTYGNNGTGLLYADVDNLPDTEVSFVINKGSDAWKTGDCSGTLLNKTTLYWYSSSGSGNKNVDVMPDAWYFVTWTADNEANRTATEVLLTDNAFFVDLDAPSTSVYCCIAPTIALSHDKKKIDFWDETYLPSGTDGNYAIYAFNNYNGSIDKTNSSCWVFQIYLTTKSTFSANLDTKSFTITPYFERTLPAAAEGFATFSSTYDVIPDAGLTAQYASEVNASTGKITWADYAATGIKAGEGALLTGTAGETYKFTPASSAVAPATNCLKAIPTATQLAQADGTKVRYVLAKPGESVGFYKVNTAGSYVNSGTAYLEVETAGLAREFFSIWDDGETTGLTAIDDESQSTMDNCFNLAGQRVAQPTKGLYIVNGKKVVIK